MTADTQWPNDSAAAPVVAAPAPAPVPPPPPVPLANGPVWPKVIGVLSIVIGGQRLVSVAGGMLASLLSQVLRGSAPSFPDLSLTEWLPSSAYGGGNVACMLLVAAGVLLLRRRRITVPLHWIAAAGMLIAQVLWGVFYVRLFRHVQETHWPFLLHVGLGGAVRLAYPAFTVVWFLRGPIRRQMRSWRTRPGREAARYVGVAWPAVLGILVMVNAGTSLLTFAVLTAIRLLGDSGSFWPHGTSLEAVVFGIALLSLPARALELAGGWLLARRRRAGMVCLLIYAGLWLLPSLSLCVLQTITTMPRQHLWQILPSSIVGALLVAALPVFLLIWFARGKVRAEVRSWRDRPAKAAGQRLKTCAADV